MSIECRRTGPLGEVYWHEVLCDEAGCGAKHMAHTRTRTEAAAEAYLLGWISTREVSYTERGDPYASHVQMIENAVFRDWCPQHRKDSQ